MLGAACSIALLSRRVDRAKDAFSFSPQAIEGSPGTEVTWTWVSELHHSVTPYYPDAGDPSDSTV